MIDPDDYQHEQDPVGWTCIRDPLPRWLDGIFNDYPQWPQRHEIIRDFNHTEDPFRLQQRLQQMNRDHLASQWSTLNNDYHWEELEIWPIDAFDRARQENGARWSRHMRTDPLGAPWQMSAMRQDHIRDFWHRLDHHERIIVEWSKMYDRDIRMWHKVHQHYLQTQEPLVITRRKFQSRTTWPAQPHHTTITIDEILPRLAVPD